MQIGEALDALIARARRSPTLDRAVRTGGRGGQHRRRARRSSASGSICVTEKARNRSAARSARAAHGACEHCRELVGAARRIRRTRPIAARAAICSRLRRPATCLRRPPGASTFFLTGRRIGRPQGAQRSAPLRRSHPSRPHEPRSRFRRRGGARARRSCRRLDSVRAYDATEALLIVGDAILQAYHAAKRQAGALDFPDLIAKARNLLSRADAAQWVLFKLDRAGRSHPGRRGAGHEPRPMDGGEGDRRGFLLRRRRRPLDRARSSPSATTSSRSSASRAPRRDAGRRCGTSSKRRIREAEKPFVARPLFLSFRSTQRGPACRRQGVREAACR